MQSCQLQQAATRGFAMEAPEKASYTFTPWAAAGADASVYPGLEHQERARRELRALKRLPGAARFH